jgi:hypothetical protein
MTAALTPGRALLLAGMPEADWLAQVRAWLDLGGWRHYHAHDSRRSPSGLPDVLAVHARRRTLLAVELKTERGTLTGAQRAWLAAFEALGDLIFYSGVWRPSQGDAVAAFLLGMTRVPPPSMPEPARRQRAPRGTRRGARR